MIAEPLRLFDCNIETDGACALIVTSRRARARPAPAARADPRRRAQRGLASHPPLDAVRRNRDDDSAARVGRQLWESSGLRPSEIDAFFCYDFFTSFVIIALEDYGFCKRGEGGPFVEDQAPLLRRRPAADQHQRRSALRGLHPRR